MAKTRHLRKHRRLRKHRKTRRGQRGGEVIQRQNLRINEEKVSTLLGVKGCTSYVNKGNYGSVMKACRSSEQGCIPPCYSVKYIPAMAEPVASAEAKHAASILAHEAQMMYMMTSESKNTGDREYINHFPQYQSSIIPLNASPWLATDFVTGMTIEALLEGTVQNNIAMLAPILYLQTMLILYNLGRLNDGFVHGDLNPGNIFILPRPKSHAQCRMEGPSSEALDFMPAVFKFNEPYYVKLIDFGSAESYLLNYNDNPVAGKSVAGQWEIDAFMAACSFHDLADIDGKAKIKGFIGEFFGPEVAEAMTMEEFDIYNNRNILNMRDTKEDALARWAEFFDALAVVLNIELQSY